MPQLGNRVREVSSSTGTGDMVLDGAVDGRHQTFLDAIGAATQTYYFIVHREEGEWECGVGTVLASPARLQRDTLLGSSTGSSVAFSAGEKDVFVAIPAERVVARDQPIILNPTITDYVETLHTASGASLTVDLSNGTVQRLATTGNATITLPGASAGKSFVVMVVYGGEHTVTWVGGTEIEWAGGAAPDATAENGKVDIFAFFQDAGATYGSVIGQDFS